MYSARYLSICTALFILVMVWGCSTEVDTENFIVDLIEQDGDNERRSRLYVLGDKYRIEIGSGEDQVVLLVDKEIGQARIVSGREQVLGIGPGALWSFSQDSHLFFNMYFETSVKNRPEGERFILRYVHHF